MLGIAAVVLGACGASHDATTGQKAAQDQQATQAQKAAQVQTLDATVVGMHYVQMAKAVDPLAARLQAEVATGKAVPSTQVKATTSAVEQFDTAAASLAAPGNLQVTLHTLLAADGHLVKDLAAVKGTSPATPMQKAAILTDLNQRQSAASALSAVLGTSPSTH
jgi:hypothetical protein